MHLDAHENDDFVKQVNIFEKIYLLKAVLYYFMIVYLQPKYQD